ncbi:hypothetical protein K491DRAFT_213699 [Lophiostoma macrostomum CBS 122681]|uniref:Uncharacterized protein n=1 Tax=Lophiostoma macrostomum CBS 122681 TaxID=1314788 RepID=A0A6A6SQB6_9PLEO|nr:hypothetical protein K491DRAFT_213699 [Lophiostoma macrostomum CBS 122681]
MLPTAGLYLPRTLHRRMDPTLERPPIRISERHSLDRISTEQRPTDRISVQRSRASSEEVTQRFSSLSTVFHFADFVSSLNGVPSEKQTLVRIIQRVRNDVNRASRLRSSPLVLDFCEGWPEEQLWIDGILLDVQVALNDIGAYVESVRGSSDEGGTVKMKQKFEWVLGHQDKLRTKQEALSTCHQSLQSAIQLMQNTEMRNVSIGQNDGFVHEIPATPWMRDDQRDVYRSPHSRQKYRTNQKNLSLPSIMVSNFEDSNLEVNSVNSTPAELAGSTPDDLPDPDNRDLYEDPPRESRTSMSQGPSLPLVSEENISHEEPPGVVDRVNSMPVLARRYRPRAVQVRKGPTKHRSLPEQLPYLPPQPSLFSDLSDYVLRSHQRDSYGSLTSSTDYGSPTSVTSSPVVPPSATWSGETRSGTSRGASETIPDTPATTVMRSSALTDMSMLTNPDSPTLLEEPPDHGVNADTSSLQPNRSVSDQTVCRSHDVTTSGVSLIQSDASSRNILLTPSASTVDLVTSQTEGSAESSMEGTAVDPTPSKGQKPNSAVAYSPTAKEAIGEPMSIASVAEISRPLTSHEKRRRAHARRMQAAYGSD